MMKRITICFLFFLIHLSVIAQNRDSLIRVSKSSGESDSARVKALTMLSELFRNDDINLGVSYGQQAYELAEEMSDNGKFKAAAAYVFGTALSWNGQFDSSIIMTHEALDIYTKLGNESRRATCLNGLGNAYAQLGDNKKALTSFFESLSAYTKLGEEKRQGIIFGNIANVYFNMDDGDNAIKYYLKSIEIKEKNKDFGGAITSYINLGGVYLDLGQIDQAELYAKKSALLVKDYGKKADSSYLLSLEGKIFLERKEYVKALEKFQLGTKVAEEVGNTPSMVTCIIQTGLVYAHMKDTAKAGPYIRKGFALLQEMGGLPIIEDSYEAIADAYAEGGYPMESYHLLKTLLSMQDTVHSRELSELIARSEALFNKEKTQHELDNYKKNALIDDLKLQRSRWLIVILVLAVGAVLMIVRILFNRNKTKQNINDQLELQNAEISAQKKSITDSINYAKKIQDSILPPEKQIKRVLADGFILYEPKDVVSGDFYWLDSRDGLSIFAAVDCTGHGVPGALMSVIGFNLLNQAVNEMGITKPSDILHHLDFGVNKLLRQSDGGNTVKDGMDLALCTYDPSTKKLQFAGVFNPAYIITKGELKQINADKFPIGINVDGVTDNYTNNEIQMYSGDMIYLFSDGYADQFGGPMGKKFKYTRFRELLLKIYTLPCEEQKRLLKKEFVTWMGGLEQVDDILVIGVRVE